MLYLYFARKVFCSLKPHRVVDMAWIGGGQHLNPWPWNGWPVLKGDDLEAQSLESKIAYIVLPAQGITGHCFVNVISLGQNSGRAMVNSWSLIQGRVTSFTDSKTISQKSASLTKQCHLAAR